MLLGRRFQITAMNRLMEAMTGYSSERVRGIHGELVVRSNTGNNRGQLYREVMQSGKAVSVEGDILNCYRRKLPVQYSVSKVIEDKDHKYGLLVIAEKIHCSEKKTGDSSNNHNGIELIGYCPKMQKVFDLIPLMAQTDASVLLTGETGTGKDKIAEVIHQQSKRSRFPFIKINCGALPLDLLESEIFGHVKGAFTGATRNKPGMFKMADKGTLFLTEIGDMPFPLQVKLLSVLDDRKFIPVGGEESNTVDIRIITATHRPLRQQVQDNTFREDLFYRLNVLHVHLPPLRERESDIPYLIDHFLKKFTTVLGKNIVGLTPATKEFLLAYKFPGNIRELSNIIEYAVNICQKKKINKEMLPPYLFETKMKQSKLPEVTPTHESFEAVLQEAVPTPILEKNYPSPPAPINTSSSWPEIEREMIIEALKKNNGNKTKAAGSLGWGRMKLWRKMKKSGLMT